jgi:hypothetical protein
MSAIIPSPNTPQRVVTISIITVTNAPFGQTKYQARYSYTSPLTGEQYLRAPVCDLTVSQPTYCLFVLDFDATAAGWTIEGITSASGPLIGSAFGPQNLSILTYDPHTKEHPKYSFFIVYRNPAADNQGFAEDPQEGNGPRTPGPTEP